MTYRTHATIAFALLMGCSGGSYNQGNDLTGLDDDDDDAQVDDSGQTDDTGSTSDDTGAQDDTGDSGVPDVCQHAWHPIHKTGWSKTFDATFNGSVGTATEEGLGASPDGDNVYVYRDAIDANGNSYDVDITVGCDWDGEGMFVLGWEGDYSYMIFDVIPVPGTVTATHDPYRRYLPPEYAVGNFGSWDYDDTITFVSEQDGKKPQVSVYQATGTYDEYGFEDLQLFDGSTVSAYKLVNTYAMVESSSMMSVNGMIEQWWVKGLGLVKEINTNTDDGTELITRDLTGYSGLTVEE